MTWAFLVALAATWIGQIWVWRAQTEVNNAQNRLNDRVVKLLQDMNHGR